MTPPEPMGDSVATLTTPHARAASALAHATTPSRAAIVRKYLKIFRASLVERMAYRGDFLFGTLIRFFPLVTTILLWQAVYAGAGKTPGAAAGPTKLAGFSFNQMIAYLLMTNISRAFSSMPGLAGGIARDIREGTLKRYVIQPVDLIGYLLSYRAAHKVAYIATSSIPYAILFFLCRQYFESFPDFPTFVGFLASCVLAFLVGFYFEACVGMVGFWFLEVTSVLYIVMTLNFFISGHMLPLDLLPKPWSTILLWLPFQYMAYFPAVVFLGRVQGWALVGNLLLELAWAMAFMLLARGLYRLGLRRYSAYGG